MPKCGLNSTKLNLKKKVEFMENSLFENENGNFAKPLLSKAKIRAIVFDKCSGKCAYCGVDLVKGWNVDHVAPKRSGGTDEIENLNPSCKDCNNYKSGQSLEEFRYYLNIMLNEKLEYLFKSKTKMQVAMNMGSIKHTLWDGKFYFERVGSSCR